MVLGKFLTGMMYRLRIFARRLGYELVVEQSPHSIHTTFEKPGKGTRAWDPDLFQRGQLYVRGYANPVKLLVQHNPNLEESDQVDIYESNKPNVVDDDGEEVSHTQVISSPRYRSYMQNDLVSQMLNPQQLWNKIIYVLMAMGVVLVVMVILQFRILGVF